MTVDIEAAFFEKVRKQMEKSELAANSNLRDHFAGLAMQGILASPNFGYNGSLDLSQNAYNISDAMLKQRSL